jgi:hypothetical protein
MNLFQSVKQVDPKTGSYWEMSQYEKDHGVIKTVMCIKPVGIPNPITSYNALGDVLKGVANNAKAGWVFE